MDGLTSSGQCHSRWFSGQSCAWQFGLQNCRWPTASRYESDIQHTQSNPLHLNSYTSLSFIRVHHKLSNETVLNESTYPCTQWAAVTIQYGVMTDPPHKCLLEICRLTCHGQTPLEVTMVPPTIRVPLFRPQSTTGFRDQYQRMWKV